MKQRVKAGKLCNTSFNLNVMINDEAHEIYLATLEVLKDVWDFLCQRTLDLYGA